MSLQPVRGMRDLLGAELDRQKHIIRTAEEIALLYNYESIETPIVEYTSVFKRTLGETSDIVGKEMYTFADRNNESMTLRPEGTASVVRAIISEKLTQTLPQKRIYSGPMFRYERPQKGRYRQFYQLGVECLGQDSPYADVECIALADHILKTLGIVDYNINLNTLGDMESRQLYKEALIQYFSKYEKDLSEDSRSRLQRNPLRILDSKDENDQKISLSAPKFESYLNDESKAFFETVLKGLDILKIGYELNPHLVRGLDYYCHTAFEFKTTSLGAQDALGGGGRYDGLMQQMGGPSIPGVGWAVGLDRLALLLPEFQAKCTLRIAVIPIGDELELEAVQLTQELRLKGFTTEVFLKGNLGKRFKQADKALCSFAVVFGSEELAQKQVKVRNLQSVETETTKETTVDSNHLISHLSSLI
ncbi:MAG: histidine--tRNA ligase [Alphaproteobacteria bacterium]|nr:histidine--tRNA ligase [Alphaproteobacteria bacterium]